MLTTTILAPAGSEKAKDTTIPARKQIIEIIAELVTTLLKLLKTRIDVRAGKIIRLEISMVPMIRMPTTIVIAVNKAISIL